MNRVFASASAMLAADFIDKFSKDKLDSILLKIGSETGARIDRSMETVMVTGRWSWIIESHDIFLKEFRNLSEAGLVCDKEQEADIPADIQPTKDMVSSAQSLENSDHQLTTKELVAGFTNLIHVHGQNRPSGAIFDSSTDIDSLRGKSYNVDDYDDGEDTCMYDMEDHIDGSGKRSPVDSKAEIMNTPHGFRFDQSEQNFYFPKTVKQEPSDGNSSMSPVTGSSLLADASKKIGDICKNVSCSQCDYVGKSRQTLKAHTRRCHVKKFKCDQCSSCFGYMKDLNRHKRNSHGDYETPEGFKPRRGRKKVQRDPNEVFACDQCPYVGKRKEFLREHKRRLHGIRFHCDECEKSFGYNKDLSRHKRTVHCLAEFQCPDCKKLFKTKRSLDIHSKCHEADYIKHAFECQVCEKRYTTKYVLDNHVKAEHMGMKKSVICPICGKSFTQKETYRQHANVHAGIREYVCDVCGKSFSYKKSLQTHKFLHENIRKYQCSICDKRFLHKNSLQLHRNVHQGARDYMCTICGQSFTQKQSLVRHERIHSGEKPYSCSLCLKSFRDASIIRRHIILMHKKDPKRWQEDMVNNVPRKPNHFVEVFDSIADISTLNPEIMYPLN